MIKQTVHFSSSPQRIYHAFMDDWEHAAFTGNKAKIKNKVGGKFSVWDGYATGKTIELVHGEKIVQTWRAADWPEGVESTITLILHPDGEGTKLEFTHENVPPEFEKDIEQGWNDYYWKPLEKYLSKSE